MESVAQIAIKVGYFRVHSRTSAMRVFEAACYNLLNEVATSVLCRSSGPSLFFIERIRSSRKAGGARAENRGPMRHPRADPRQPRRPGGQIPDGFHAVQRRPAERAGTEDGVQAG